jgi:clan AA aspartic protease (TIGR02281 family)
MVASRALRFLGLAILASTLPGGLLRAQDPPPAEPVSEPGPEAILKDHDLKRSGTTWLLPGETTVLKDLRDATDLYRQVREGMAQQQQLELGAQDRKVMAQQLREDNDSLGQQISQFDQELEKLNFPGGGNLVQLQRDQLNRQRQDLVAQNNRVINQLNSIQEESKEQEQEHKLQLNAEVGQSREKYMQAILDLRKSVDDVTGKYTELAKNAEVTKALDSISVSSKTKQKLGPSKALRDAIARLEKAEGTVQTETIALERESGVFHLFTTLINGKKKEPVRMVFDTGAGLTTISSKVADSLGLKPKPTDEPITMKIADGSEIKGKKLVIPFVRVGKFTIPNVECAVMPAEKLDVDPLLGQTFFKHFKVEFSSEAGKLSLKKLDTGDTAAEAKMTADADSAKAATKASSKATTKARKPRIQPKAAPKTKRSTRGRQGSGDQAIPDGEGADPQG